MPFFAVDFSALKRQVQTGISGIIYADPLSNHKMPDIPVLQSFQRFLTRHRQFRVDIGKERYPQEAQEVHSAPLRLPFRAQLGETSSASTPACIDQGFVLVVGLLVLFQQALEVGLDPVELGIDSIHACITILARVLAYEIA